ncbi:MAG: FHA domain-containing protein [Planctomycetaceae bacterium]|nr:FHA domain-containing protein [Planctomycetaceae bacterium]
MPDLIIQSGKNRGRKLVLPEAEIFIGRDEDCQIRLASNDISRRHCRLTCRADTILVRDLGSRNGTFVNNMLLETEVALKPGDTLRVGPITLQVPLRRPAAPAASAPAKKEKATGRQPSSSADSASDDDIASWLSDESLNDGASSGETTIISRSDAAAAKAAAAAAEQSSAAAAPSSASRPVESVPQPAARKKSQTVADEAAEIIRRHWAQVRQKEN